VSAVGADPAAIVDPAGVTDASAKTVRREQWNQLKKSKTFMVGMVICTFWVVCAFIGYRIVPHSPFAQDLLHTNARPNSTYWFGTDQIGRDIFARVITGVRVVLLVAFFATLMGTVLGTFLGLLTGYLRGWVDEGLGRFMDAVLALPVIVTGVLVIAALGASTLTLTIAIGIVFTPLIARTVRTAVIQERELDYITAAQLRWESGLYIMLSELLPNVLSPVVVEFTVRLGYAIFTVAALSFLGLGIQPPTPDWGGDIATNIVVVPAGYWWEVLFAAAAIASLVVGINLVADSIETVLDQ
jgi:peptide/nickel transport system permease protein